MSTRQKNLLILLGLLLTTCHVFAADVYVDPNDADDAGGTLEDPYQKVATALTNVGDGDTVYLMAGTYNDVSQGSNWYIDLDDAKTVTFRPYNNADITLEFKGGKQGIRIDGDASTIVHFVDITFDGSGGPDYVIYKPTGKDATVTFTRCTLYNTGSGNSYFMFGATGTGGLGTLIFDNCTITADKYVFYTGEFALLRVKNSSVTATANSIFYCKGINPAVFGDIIFEDSVLSANATTYGNILDIEGRSFDGVSSWDNLVVKGCSITYGRSALRVCITEIENALFMNNTITAVGPSGGESAIQVGFENSRLDAWAASQSYVVDNMVYNDVSTYICYKAHTSSASDEPGTGANWREYWSPLICCKAAIIGNTCSYNTPGQSHAIFVGFSADSAEIAYNNVSGGEYQLVVKARRCNIHHNVLYGPKPLHVFAGGEHSIWNNTCYGTSSYACYISGQDGIHTKNNTIINNIFDASGGSTWSMFISDSTLGQTHYVDYNFYVAGSSGTVGIGNIIDRNTIEALKARWQKFSVLFSDNDTHSIMAEPHFVNGVNGNYHLKSQAGRWDTDSQNWVQDDITSPCIDAGNPSSPIGHEPFPNGGLINIGAYGSTTEASKSYFGGPVCETIIVGDINGDCKVDFSDFGILALHWLEKNTTYDPSTLEFGQTNRWSVDELNDSNIRPGDVWSSTVTDYLIVDDFESFSVLPSDPNPTGLLMQWAFDAVGPQIVDGAGKGFGFLIDAARTSPGYDGTGSCLECLGIGDHAAGPTVAQQLNGLSALTISLWVKSDVTDTNAGFIHGEEPAGNDNRGMRYNKAGASGGGTNVIKIGITSTGGTQQLESSSGVQTTEWQHLVMTWNSGNQLALYIDGVLDTPTYNSEAKSGTLVGYTNLLVGKGAQDDEPSESWAGLIDDVRIYNYALSPGEVMGLAGYVPAGVLHDTWSDSGSAVSSLSTDTNGNQAMRIDYDGTDSPYEGEVSRTTPFADLTTGGAKVLSVWFSGDPDNLADRMYLTLTDGDTPSQSATVLYDGDPADLDKAEWQEWNVDLRDFTGVNVANASNIAIGLAGSGTGGVMYFDDIRVYTGRYMPLVEKPAADLNNDFVVDFEDLRILAASWLNDGLSVTTDEQVILNFSLSLNPDIYTQTTFKRTPQFAIWLEDPAYGKIRTVWVTQTIGTGQMARPVALPYWVSRWNIETQSSGFPTPHNPVVDAVTGATPTLDFATETKVPINSEWDYYIEINASTDYNSIFAATLEDGTSDLHHNGQPSIIYKGKITALPGQWSIPQLIGRTDQLQSVSYIIPDLEGITTAKNLLSRIEVTCRSSE